MKSKAIVIQTPAPVAPIVLMPKEPTKDEKSRIGIYERWLADTGQAIDKPDFAAYAKYLLTDYKGAYKKKPLAPATVKAHLGTVKGRYKLMLTNNDFREWLVSRTPQTASAADKKAFVDETVTRLANTLIDPAANIKLTKVQDKKHGRRLTEDEANALIDAPFTRPNITYLMRYRDAAIIALMLCTGIREAELCALNVEDLRQSDETGIPALLVRHGKGNKERYIPYGDLIDVLVYVDRWMELAGIRTGAVFRGLNTNGMKALDQGIYPRSVNRILANYGKVQPHDLRRTYARRLHESGKGILTIKNNLGHSSYETTEGYIGELDLSERCPSKIFALPLERVTSPEAM